MYIGHYKSVNSNNEFFSSLRKSLDFPTQVEKNGERYLLNTTYSVPSNSVLKRMHARADDLGIPKDVPVE